jgi:hypothetical protein
VLGGDGHRDRASLRHGQQWHGVSAEMGEQRLQLAGRFPHAGVSQCARGQAGADPVIADHGLCLGEAREQT